MKLEHVIALCRLFETAKLGFWIDGGWGVDVLIGEQTRPHADLDLAVAYPQLPAFQAVLERQGYTRLDRPGDPDWNWVLRNADGLQVDLHGFIRDAEGNGILGDPANGDMYPTGALEGTGALNGMALRCVAAPFVLQFRNAFEPRSVDRHDVALLCSRFDLPLPPRFRNV